MLLMPNATRRALQMVHVCEIRWMARVAIRTSDGMADKSLWSRFLHFWCFRNTRGEKETVLQLQFDTLSKRRYDSCAGRSCYRTPSAASEETRARAFEVMQISLFFPL